MNRWLSIYPFAAMAMLVAGTPALAETPVVGSTQELAAPASRQRIIIHPSRITPGPNSKRQCRAQLVQEYRVSGTVIVPQMRCWWE